MSTLTPNYSFILPGVNDPTDQDLWGGYLNENFSNLDTFLKLASGLQSLTKTANYTILVDDINTLFECDATGGNFTLSLPSAASAGDGFTIAVKKIDATSNTVTVDGNGSETIDGDTTYDLSGENQSIILVCDGTKWLITADKVTASGIPSASTTVEGITRYATDAEVIGRALTTAAVTPKGLDALLDTLPPLTNIPVVTSAANGKIVIGAVTIQWGLGQATTTDFTNNFGTAFSSSPYAVVANIYIPSPGGIATPVGISGATTSTFNARSTGANYFIHWIAIGPT